MRKLSLIQGGKIDSVEHPEEVEFACPSCGASCLLYPRAKPMAVQHAKPACDLWKKGETEKFLIKAGVHLLVPGSEKN